MPLLRYRNKHITVMNDDNSFSLVWLQKHNILHIFGQFIKHVTCTYIESKTKDE